MTSAPKVIIDWSAEDGCHVAKVPALPGCVAHRDTRQEAEQMMQEAITFWIETAKEDGVVLSAGILAILLSIARS